MEVLVLTITDHLLGTQGFWDMLIYQNDTWPITTYVCCVLSNKKDSKIPILQLSHAAVHFANSLHHNNPIHRVKSCFVGKLSSYIIYILSPHVAYSGHKFT